MIKKENVVYLTDDKILLYSYKKDKIYKYKLNNDIVYMGRIIDPDRFIKYFKEIIKELNINQGLFSERMHLIVNCNYSKIDIITLKNIFKYFNYHIIKIDYETRYYYLSNDNAWLNLQKNYLSITLINKYNKIEYYIIKYSYFKNIDDLYKYIKYLVGSRELYLIGNEKYVRKMYYNFENKFKNITYAYSNSDTFLLDRSLGNI